MALSLTIGRLNNHILEDIIERVIGTAMKMAHELPGTTFSNTKERGTYNSDATAILTLGN